VNGSVQQELRNGHRLFADPKTNALSVGATTTDNPKTNAAVYESASITLKGAGNDGTRGVDQMLVGFTKVLSGLTAITHYGTPGGPVAGSRESSMDSDIKKAPFRDIGDDVDKWSAWSDISSDALIQNSSRTDVQRIDSSDSPDLIFPAFLNQAAAAPQGDKPIQSIELSEVFQLYVAAGAKDPNDPFSDAPVLNDVYTRLASASWQWTGNGSFDATSTYNPTRQPGIEIVSNVWKPTNDGSTSNPKLKIFNDEISNGSWPIK
jgi:hypothetical protein